MIKKTTYLLLCFLGTVQAVYRSSEKNMPRQSLYDLCLKPGVRKEIEDIIALLKQPVRKPYHAHALLLYGPSGVGKTTLARIIAYETGCELFEESASNFVNSYQGSGPETVKALFEEAQEQNRPVIIFIDEIEAIASVDAKYNSSREYENALKTLWTELDRCKQLNRHVFVIVATNAYDKLDVRIRRRFIKNTIAIEVPTRQERAKILRYHAHACEREISDRLCTLFSYLTYNWSGSDLQLMIEQVAEKMGNERIIQQGMLFSAFNKIYWNKQEGEKMETVFTRQKSRDFGLRCAEALVMAIIVDVGREIFSPFLAPVRAALFSKAAQ